MTLGPDSSQEPEYADLRPLLLKIFRNTWFILGVVFLAGVLAFGILKTTPDSYEASASIMLNPNRDAADQSDTLVGLVTTRDIAEAVITSLGDQLPSNLQNVADLVDTVNGSSGSGDLIEITVTVEDPALASLIVNAWAEEYVARVNEIYGPVEVDTSLAEKALADYSTAQAALAVYIAQDRTSDLQRLIDEKQSLIDSLQASRQAVLQKQVNAQVQSLSDSYIIAQRLEYLLSDVNSLLTQVEDGSATGDSSNGLAIMLLKVEAYASLGGTADSDGTTGVLPGSLQLQLSDPSIYDMDRETQIAELQAMKTTLEARLTEVSANIVSQSELLLGNEVLTLADGEDGAAIAELEEELRALNAQLEEESSKERELTASRDSAWEFYQTVKQQQEELTISADFTEDIVSVASLSPQAEPQAKGTLKTVGIAALVGLLLAVGSIWLVDYLYPDYEFSNMLPKRLRKK